MRITFFIFILSLSFSSCQKDKFTSAPQISFKEFRPNQGNNRDGVTNQPYLVFEITDGDGDLDTDSSKIFVRNTLTNKVDSSLRFPELGSSAGKNFKGEVQVGLFSVMAGRDLPSTQRPYVDTLSFEVYVNDKAKNKSNVIIAGPFYYFTLP
ncbi:MAG: hypothetical protein WKF35_10490 [Ferruginibacter sp.]